MGGSTGTALLNTVAVSATSRYLHTHNDGPVLAARAAVHGCTTAYWWGAGAYALSAFTTALLFRRTARTEPVSPTRFKPFATRDRVEQPVPQRGSTPATLPTCGGPHEGAVHTWAHFLSTSGSREPWRDDDPEPAFLVLRLTEDLVLLVRRPGASCWGRPSCVR